VKKNLPYPLWIVPWVILLDLVVLVGCNRSSLPFTQIITSLPPEGTEFIHSSSTPTSTSTLYPTPSQTATRVRSKTPTPTNGLTPTISLTPTFDFPDVVVQMQANCRYGPGTAYLYSFGMYKGDHAEIHGRNYSGNWLWIKPENLERHCWISSTVVEIQGDIRTVKVVQSKLPHSTLYGPPQDVKAVRDGELVTVSWNRVWMTKDDDRGYLIEATVCQNGNLFMMAVHTDDTSYVLTDESGCSGDSGGLLYTVEKHGYTDPVKIEWP
jgi:hypothetical protein